MSVELVLGAHHKELGGFGVDRVLPALARRHIGPYVLLDHSTPSRAPVAVAAHPHIGLSTITWLFDGEIVHRDGLANTQVIRPGEVNWMTAGRGIVHSERSAPGFSGEHHAIQLWVGLTAAHEETAPDFQHVPRAALPVVEDGGATARVIAGGAYGVQSPLRTFTPQFYVELRLPRGARFPLPREHAERAAYIVDGRVSGHDARHMLVFAPGGEPVIEADTDAVVMLLGGAPIATPRMWWNFVSTRPERIEQAKLDWSEGRFALPPDDDGELGPLPR